MSTMSEESTKYQATAAVIAAWNQRAGDRLDTTGTAGERGRWIEIDLDTSICSLCNNPQDYETTYCPECGALMDADATD